MLRAGVTQRHRTDGAETEAVRAAEDLVGHGERERVVGPGPQVEQVAVDVGTVELLAAARQVDLARVDAERRRSVSDLAIISSVRLRRLLISPAAATSSVRDVVPRPIRLSAIVWASRPSTPDASTSCLSALSARNAMRRPTSTSISNTNGAKKFFNTSTTSTAGNGPA